MMNYRSLRKIYLQWMVLLVLALVYSCTSTRVLTTGELMYFSKNISYIVHGERNDFLIKDATISDRILSGRIVKRSQGHSYESGNGIHLFLLSDSDINIEKGEFINIMIDRVAKVEEKEVFGVGILVAAGAFLVIMGFSVYLLSFNLLF